MLFQWLILLWLALPVHTVAGQSADKTGLNGFIRFEGNGLSFEQVMEGFEQRTGYFVQYDMSLVPAGKKFSINYRNVRARQALTDFLSQSGLTFLVKGEQIILKKAAEIPKQFVLSGRVYQEQSGEMISYAEVRNLSSGTVAYSSDAGYFTLYLVADTNKIRISYPGFHILNDTVIGDRNYFVKYEMSLAPEVLAETKITGNSETHGIQTVSPGQPDHYHVSRLKMKRLPHLLGEPDILHVMSLYPGIVGGSEGMLGMYIRGGASDQNLILLDDVPIFNCYHLYGIFSIFNDEIVKSATMMKGSFPARYGGRLSAVVNVQSKEGNEYRIKGTFSTGVMATKLFLEGPLVRNRTTFTVAFRRSHVDLFAKPAARLFLNNDSLENNVYYFWDLNARITHRFSYRSRLSLSFYTGRDVGGVDQKNNVDNGDISISQRRQQLSSWGNQVASVKWNYYPGRKLGIILRAHSTSYSYFYNQNYKLKKTNEINPAENIDDFTEYKLQNGIRDLEASGTLDYKITPRISLMTGGAYVLHRFIPGNRTLTSEISGNSTQLSFNDDQVNTPEFVAFAEINGKYGKRFYYVGGIRNSWYIPEKGFYYILPEPRLNLRYRVAKRTWMKAAASRNWQFFHQLTNLTLGLPSDLWVPSTRLYKPSMADQASIGFTNDQRSWQFSGDVFYKKLSYLLEYKNNAGYVTSAQNWQDAVTSGSGEAYGLEAMAEKTVGRITGWVCYAWMHNYRQFAELNNGRAFPARYDRRHNFYIAGVYQLNEHVEFSFSWIYNSGFAITTPISHFISATPTDPYREVFVYGDRNNTRTSANHRLDFAVNFEKKHTWFVRTWTVGLFNAYNRRNPFYVNLTYDNQGNRVLSQVSLLPILPNISFKLSF